MTTINRNSLILEHLYLADKIAKSKKKKLSHISYDELQSAAYLGLVEAAQTYRPEDNDCFGAYAVWRIIGAVRDYLRELAWGTRTSPQKMENISSSEESFFSNAKEVFDSEFFEDIIKSLPAVNKTVIRMYFIEEKKIAEIADFFEVHQSRISQILTDSKNKLYNTFGACQAELWALVA